jgi:malate dehydrogenase (quinone)
MRDAREVEEFLDGDYEFDEEAFREETIANFPRADDADAQEVAVAADDD